MRIFLVDDNAAFRNNLKLFLEGHLNYEVIGEAGNGKEFLNAQKYLIDIVLMDINMPHVNGMEAAKLGTWKNSGLKIIAVSQFIDSVDLKTLIECGFKGFVSKTNLYNELNSAITEVMKGGCYFNDEIQLKDL